MPLCRNKQEACSTLFPSYYITTLNFIYSPPERGRGVSVPIPKHTPLSPLKRGIREINSPALRRGIDPIKTNLVMYYTERMIFMSEKNVQVYSLSTCSHCKSVKKFLADCTVHYDFVDVDLLEGDERKAIIEDVKKLNPRCSFPTIIIGSKVIVGYKEKEIREALGL